MTSETMIKKKSIYNIKINDINGYPINLKSNAGKKLLIVNVASKCMYTPQYAELQELHDKYSDKLYILGIPCNQFGNQEPGSNQEIKDFCLGNYGVSFTISEKIDIKGEFQHPLYAWLTESALNGSKNTSVDWNFQKYLMSETGKYVNCFPSDMSPLDAQITKHLK